MKKFLSVMLAVLMVGVLLTAPAQAAYNNWGNTDTVPLLQKNMPSYLLHAGVSYGGATSMTSSDLAVPLAYSYVRKAISSDSAFSLGTLPNGSPGQLLTLFITSVAGSGTFKVTPVTKTGFVSVTFGTAKQQATFLYVDDTTGWIMIAHSGSPTVTIP